MKKNIFKDFVWERNGNGDYLVTYLYTGISIIVIPRLDSNKYCIKNSDETEKNFYNQDIPKRYTKFEIMDILKGLTGTENICIKCCFDTKKISKVY